MAKKILVISNMYPTPEHKTFGIFVANQVNALREAGHTVDVIAIKNPKSGKLNLLKKYLAWFLQATANLLTKGKSYEVVHAHYVFPSGMIARMYKKMWGTPYVVTSHGGDIDKMAKKNARIHQWTKEILQGSEHVIAVGQALHDEIAGTFGVDKQKISILNMGVNRSVFQPLKKEELRRELGIPEGSEPILFVGNIIPEKGVKELLLAFREVLKKRPQSRLYLIGASRNAAFKGELDGIIKEGAAGMAEFLGMMPQADLAKWMSAAELFVLPSHLEGFGLVALEAMSCHTPVVAANVGGLTYLLQDGSGLLVEPANPESLAEGMLAVLENPKLKADFVLKGEQLAKENAEERIIEKLEKIYNHTREQGRSI
ncbi:glycosyltransferase [Bacillus infantis]|uniref:glycosyltransferase n=1 Tax=Bacillus infantis TaxID=324767 RepID=UPI00200424BD|nr:glycosyltransferase [Bacillus infantis]